jgi:hypothetical protein
MPFSTLSKIGVLFLFFAGVIHAAALDCGKARIKSQSFGKATLSTARVCTNKARDQLLSENCRKGKCAALQFKLATALPVGGSVGKPGFEMCKAAQGMPELIEFQFKGGPWYKLDRCLFTSDGSFVDTGTLIARTRVPAA